MQQNHQPQEVAVAAGQSRPGNVPTPGSEDRRKGVLIVLGTPHRLREPGKASPDGRLRESIYGRTVAAEVAAALRQRGHAVAIDLEAPDLPAALQSPSAAVERRRELRLRVERVNALCRQWGAGGVLYVSIHVNASGSDGRWHDAHGWQVVVGRRASAQSRRLACCLAAAARARGLTVRQPAPRQPYWQQPLCVLDQTRCPAVLTENLFQDHRADVGFLLSDAGRRAIVELHAEGIDAFLRER